VTEVRKSLRRPGSRQAGGWIFLMQELNREAGTRCPRSSQDLETTRAGVDMKSMIEQMRRTGQNIE